MKQMIANIWKSGSVKNVGKLLTANVFAQAVGVLIYPILTRVYAPADFALLSLFTSIAGVFCLLATAEYQYAVVLPAEEGKARSLVHLCLLLLVSLTLLLFLSVPFAPLIARLFKAPDLARYWWLLPLSVFGLGLWNILNYWYIRRSAFTRVSGYQMTQSLFSASGKIGLGALGWLQGGMIVATVVAPLLSLLVSGVLAWKQHLKELLQVDRAAIRVVAREYANFPKFSLPRALVNSVGVSLPIWLLTPHFGLESVGRFSLAMMAAVLPLSLIARACNQVLYQRVSERVQQRRSTWPVLRSFLLGMGGAMAVGMTVVYWLLPQLVTLFFGAEWTETAAIIRRLYPYLLLTPFCGAICFLSDVFGKQKAALWMETVYVAAMGLSLLAGIAWSTFMGSVSLFSWTRFAYLGIQLVWFLSLVRRYERCLA